MNISTTYFNDSSDYEALTESTKTQSQGVVGPPSLEEVIEAINKLKDNNSPDPVAIPFELIKNGGKETSKYAIREFNGRKETYPPVNPNFSYTISIDSRQSDINSVVAVIEGK
ncbi:hypothetical protein TNCV_4779841 [Trichonephila clavipes]|nr:hypothetical protein TNCV_4779841 [Trichonephila clavipes]